MEIPHPKTDSPLSVLIIGQGVECDILNSHLINHPSILSVGHETGAHHAFGELRSGRVNTIFIDPYSCNGGLDEATFLIFEVRLEFPEIVFVLFIDTDKIDKARNELFTGEGGMSSYLKKQKSDLFIRERSRLSHYFQLEKNIQDLNFTDSLNAVLRSCVIWHQSIINKRPERILYEYDVALSFAGEDRDLAEKIATVLKTHGVRVFYDSFEQANLWGKDLFVHLHEVYSKKSRFCMMIISSAYLDKMWTVHERKAAQSRALKERDNEYVLPIRIDNTELPGLPDTIAYLDISRYGYLKICQLFIQKIGGVLGTLS